MHPATKFDSALPLGRIQCGISHFERDDGFTAGDTGQNDVDAKCNVAYEDRGHRDGCCSVDSHGT